MSSTVTSVEGPSVAVPIVRLLNRISACATVPVSVWDRRGDRVGRYPEEHLAALVDPSARAGLLRTTHSLWYGYAKLLLHQALAELDVVLADVPGPVRTAICAELVAEERGLREALAEYTTGIDAPAREDRRCWDFGAPFAAFDKGVDLLDEEDRKSMNRLERGAEGEHIAKAVSDMRLVLDVSRRCTNPSMMLLDVFTLSDDPVGGDRYYLNVEAPLPNGRYDRHDWIVEIGQWDIDTDDPEHEGETARGEPVLVCSRASAPPATELVELFDRSGGRPELLAEWAVTPVGEKLAGTAFVVTKRFDEPNFVELFPVCRCGSDGCLDCGGVQLTPRTAEAMYSAACLLADQAYDDVSAHGDDPVGRTGDWAVFDEFPRITWRQQGQWRRQAARAFDDLRDDLTAGEWPRPRCPAEEMAAHLMLRYADDGVADEWLSISKRSLAVPAHEDDLDWPLLRDVLFQDIDILCLFEEELDGIEDPETDLNRRMAMGDYRPEAWFKVFDNMEPRDPDRPYRR